MEVAPQAGLEAAEPVCPSVTRGRDLGSYRGSLVETWVVCPTGTAATGGGHRSHDSVGDSGAAARGAEVRGHLPSRRGQDAADGVFCAAVADGERADAWTSRATLSAAATGTSTTDTTCAGSSLHTASASPRGW